MWRVLVVVGAVVVTALGLYAHSRAGGGYPVELLGYPVTNDSNHDFAWISLGGTGWLVLGAGVGVVEIGVFGIGALFATGQACAGGIAIGQAAAGVTFVVAQLGVGLTGYVQGGAGGYMRAQGALAADGKEFFAALDAWFGRVLRLSLR